MNRVMDSSRNYLIFASHCRGSEGEVEDFTSVFKGTTGLIIVACKLYCNVSSSALNAVFHYLAGNNLPRIANNGEVRTLGFSLKAREYVCSYLP